MKKLLSDTEITIVRDIIKLRRKGRQVIDVIDSTAGDTILSTTTEEEGADTVDTEDAMTADSSADTSEAAGVDDFDKVTFSIIIAIPGADPGFFLGGCTNLYSTYSFVKENTQNQKKKLLRRFDSILFLYTIPSGPLRGGGWYAPSF
jgi:hypothetical protein